MEGPWREVCDTAFSAWWIYRKKAGFIRPARRFPSLRDIETERARRAATSPQDLLHPLGPSQTQVPSRASECRGQDLSGRGWWREVGVVEGGGDRRALTRPEGRGDAGGAEREEGAGVSWSVL